jgi:VWFA-related protein
MTKVKLVVLCAVGLVTAGFVASEHSLFAAARQTTRTVHVSVTTNDAVPVADLIAEDFEVKEDGKVRDIVSAEITTVPIRMTILVADEGTGSFQQALVALIQPLQAFMEVSLVSVIAQPEQVLDFTSDPEKMVAGIEKLGPRTVNRGGGQLMEALAEAANSTPAPGTRSVIVVMRLGGSAASSIRPEDVREALRTSGTMLYAFSPTGHTGGGGGAPRAYVGATGAARAHADYAAAETIYRNRNLESVMNDGSKQTGGRHIQFAAATIVKVMEQLAQELHSQYELTYTLPAGVKPSDRLEVSTKRRGLRVYAPTRIAN